MKTLYNQIWIPLFVFFISSMQTSLLVTAQITNDNTFNSTDRGHGFGDGFVGGSLADLKVQMDGKIIVVGSFTKYNGHSAFGIVRLKGTTEGEDSAFVTGSGFAGGTPKKVILQADGKIVVIGTFTTYNGTAANGMVRIHTNGLIDNTFSIGSGTFPAAGALTALKVLSSGKFIVAGLFTSINGSVRAGLARLNANGTVDNTFAANIQGASFFSSTFGDVDVQSDGKILLGGVFLNNFLIGASIPYPLGALVVRFGVNGGIDPTFTKPESFGGGLGVLSLYVATGDNFVIGGQFSLNTINGINHNVARIMASGSPDATFFQPGISSSNTVYKVIQTGTQIVVGGNFKLVGTSYRGRIARLQNNGTLDAAFAIDSGANNTINTLASEASGKIVVGGSFSRYDERGRYSIARISTTGSVDAPYSIGSGADRKVYALKIQPDQKTIIGGDFSYFNWNASNNIARILPNGQYDPSFSVGNGINGIVRSLALQSDGKVIAGGQFDSYNGTQQQALVRLLSTGSIDPSFNPGSGTASTIYDIWVQGDGKILIGGDFSSFSGHVSPGLARLNPDGSWDNTFDVGTGFSGTVRKIAVMRDSLIFVAGDFFEIQGTTRRGIARLQMNGTLDAGFNPGAGINTSGSVYSIAFQTDKKVIIGGLFDSYNGNSRTNLARLLPSGIFDPSFDAGLLAEGPVYDLAVDANGKIIAVGNFEGKAIGRNGIVRLKPSGAKDPKLGGGDGADGDIDEIEEDPSGGFIIAGDFNSFDEAARNRVARLNDDEVTVTTWDGTSWDFGVPDDDPLHLLHCIIDGDYTNPGYTCDDLFINFGKAFNPSSNVYVKGNALSNSDLANGTIVLNGTASSQSFEGKANNLTIDNSLNVSLNGPSLVKGTLKLTSGTLITNDYLTLVSNASGTGRIGKVEVGAGLSGEVNVQRYVGTGVAGWHLIGAPIQFPTQTEADWSDDFTITSNSLFLHNEAGMLNTGDEINGWELFHGNVVPGKGYRAWLNSAFFNVGNPHIIDNKGSLITGPFSFDLTYTPGSYGGGGWNLLGNPYACEIDWNAIYPANASLVGGEVHIWNQDHYGSYVGGVAVNGGVRFIPSNQGYFVKATAMGASLFVTEDAKPSTPQSNSLLRSASVLPDVGLVKLISPDGKMDETAVRINSMATLGFDLDYDAHKFINPQLNLFSIAEENISTAIQARPPQPTVEFPLGYTVSEPGAFQFLFEFGNEISQGRDWFIKDNTSGTITPIQTGTPYYFQTSASTLSSNQRFFLLGYATLVGEKIGLVPTPRVVSPVWNEKLIIHNATTVFSISIYDISGRILRQSHGLSKPQITMDLDGLTPGLYWVRMQGGFGTHTQKIVKH